MIATISNRGAKRWAGGHPWVYRSDVAEPPAAPAGIVAAQDNRGRPLGWALWSPASEISLRLLDPDPRARIDAGWWRDRLARAIERRRPLADVANAYRLVHGEGDGLPSLVCDRYDQWLVVQLMSAGLEAAREPILSALQELTGAEGVLARNDAALRAREALPRETTLLYGEVPEEIEVEEHGVRYLAAPWRGQKTGAFLDQRENRVRIGGHARGRALDCFSYHGSFALHLAKAADRVTALDISAPALERARENAERNRLTNIEFVVADAFDFLRERERAGDRYDTIVVDPPAFAKNRPSLAGAIRGYKDVNLRAMRLLAPGGMLFTASCSFHLTKPLFLEMLQAAAADSGRRIALREILGQPLDHPEVLTIPETGYIKAALLEALD
ncbi:MAG: 23S rRNA (cytosine(1962)-C(5))-methyltransferase [uncultured Phycisphaerae bacterium]|uniref:23S rRNA (Cytosine(1962)-C(5))-methyltransferase n=1 Tax=uncultured Phycisphaerae bacterium TaxID=904963 RepID=A0A6J4PG63_9BACT|nr:MAG: 23S rRNA (cytosine(1962)-C(5))-methyltransferase [uncultured Phycisphaerae bacterium]